MLADLPPASSWLDVMVASLGTGMTKEIIRGPSRSCPGRVLSSLGRCDVTFRDHHALYGPCRRGLGDKGVDSVALRVSRRSPQAYRVWYGGIRREAERAFELGRFWG